MCTITFLPKSEHHFILTSNRDESPGRETLSPKVYMESGVALLYPKDALAGGTWIGVSSRKRIASLMNGGFEAHNRLASYRKSRGVVLKDLLKSDNSKNWVENYDFFGIEPFTVIFIDHETEVQLFQLVWDGTDYHLMKKKLIPQIWSSSPLYPETLRTKRNIWFNEFLEKTPNPFAADILQFHKSGGEGDLNSNLIMDRGFVKTKSITQIVADKDGIKMRYEDLEINQITSTTFKK